MRARVWMCAGVKVFRNDEISAFSALCMLSNAAEATGTIREIGESMRSFAISVSPFFSLCLEDLVLQ